MENLLIAIGFTFFIAFFLIYLIAKHDRDFQKKKKQKEESQKQVFESFKHFTKFCTDLCEYLKLDIQDVQTPEAGEVVIRAESANPITRVQYLVVGIEASPDQEIDYGKLREISDMIVSDRLSKGIVITTGKIAEQIHSSLDLAPMEFIDGVKIEELKKKIIL
jgi:hypothetical protein